PAPRGWRVGGVDPPRSDHPYRQTQREKPECGQHLPGVGRVRETAALPRGHRAGPRRLRRPEGRGLTDRSAQRGPLQVVLVTLRLGLTPPTANHPGARAWLPPLPPPPPRRPAPPIPSPRPRSAAQRVVGGGPRHLRVRVTVVDQVVALPVAGQLPPAVWRPI